MKKRKGVLTKVKNKDLIILKIDPERFWRKVSAIGSFAFCDTDIESIDIPDSVTIINDRAFMNCKKLKSVKLPKTLTYIGVFAFSGSNIENIDLPDSIKVLKYGTFEECNNLGKVKLPSSLQEIASNAFTGCGIEEIDLPKSVISIGNSAFAHCPKLTRVKISSVPSYIGLSAFAGTPLRDIDMPCEVQIKHDSNWFSGCKNKELLDTLFDYRDKIMKDPKEFMNLPDYYFKPEYATYLNTCLRAVEYALKDKIVDYVSTSEKKYANDILDMVSRKTIDTRKNLEKSDKYKDKVATVIGGLLDKHQRVDDNTKNDCENECGK